MSLNNGSQNRTTRKSHPVLLVLLCALISVTCGLGGAWFTMTHLGTSTGTTVQYSTSEASPSLTTSVSGSTGKTTTEAASIASPSVVEILIEVTSTGYGMFSGTYTSQGAGSGVIISEDGYIITNNHVVESATSIQVTTYDGDVYEAELVGTDSVMDIAVIKVDASGLTPAVIGDSSKIQAGDTAIVIGNPLGTLGGTVTTGIISAASRELVIGNESMELIQTDATINSGNSGGGLFDGNGNLIGIVNAKDSGTTSSGAVIEGIGFAIPINAAMEVAQELIEYGHVTNRATIGVYLQQLTSDTQKYEAGLYITDVIKGSGAEAAGLQAYDRIVSAGGQEVNSYTDLSKILREYEIGDDLEMQVIRNGEKITVTVTLTGAIEDKTE